MASFVGNVISGGEDNPVASTLYGTCSSLASTAEKVVTIANVDALLVGMTIHVKFLYSNTAADPTVNVNGTGALPLYVDGTNYPGTTPVTSWQANTMLALTYDGTAWRMNDPGSPASNNISALLNLVYPVGAIYMSTNSTDPSLLFGGTWAQIQGKFLLAADTGHTAGSTGGAETVTLQTANLPAHTHIVGAHAHGLNGHTHSVGAHVHGLNSHTHQVGAHSHGLNSHTHSLSAHAHGLAGHTHTYDHYNSTVDGTAITTAQMPNHGHLVSYSPRQSGHTTTNWGFTYQNDGCLSFEETLASSGINPTGGGQAHTHGLGGYSTNTGGNSGNTANGGGGTTGAASGTTANSTAFNTGGPSTSNTAQSTAFASGGPSTTNTANSSDFNSGATGSGTAVNKMPPYLSVYCWKRTA